jgi:hypothetical protein
LGELEEAIDKVVRKRASLSKDYAYAAELRAKAAEIEAHCANALEPFIKAREAAEEKQALVLSPWINTGTSAGADKRLCHTRYYASRSDAPPRRGSSNSVAWLRFVYCCECEDYRPFMVGETQAELMAYADRVLDDAG